MNYRLLDFFPGIDTFLSMDPTHALIRLFLILLGFLFIYLSYKDILDPIIILPMGIGLCMVNAGIMWMPGLVEGTTKMSSMFLDPMVQTAEEHINAIQIYFLQPVYALTFSNGLIACLVFLGIGAITDLDFLIANPALSMLLAVAAELGSILTFPIAVGMGFNYHEAASVAVVGGADGPMVLFTSLYLAKNLFVPITIVAYLYLSLVYAGYPFMIKVLIPKHMRAVEMDPLKIAKVPRGEKLAFCVLAGTVLCLLFPVAAPLFVCFFLGVAVKEGNVPRLIKVSDEVILNGSTLFLGFTLGCLLSVDVVVDPKMFKLIILGFIALFLSGLGGLIGGVIAYKISGGKINPLIGIAAVSCVPTTAKVAHKCAHEVNKKCFILPYAMGPNVAGVITTAIIAACYCSIVSKLP
jgi:sodium ion-translocating decarboxylase beta subunit